MEDTKARVLAARRKFLKKQRDELIAGEHGELYDWYVQHFAYEIHEKYLYELRRKERFRTYFPTIDAIKIHGINLSLAPALPAALPVVSNVKEVFTKWAKDRMVYDEDLPRISITPDIITSANAMWTQLDFEKLKEIHAAWTAKYEMHRNPATDGCM